MSERGRFTRAWFAWRRMEAPVGRFRSGSRRAASYDVENALDHLVTSVYSLRSSFLAGEVLDYVAQASRRLAALDDVAAILDRAPITEPERERFRAYLAATRDVLEAIRAADLSPPAEP